jgi:hypothetical protein
LPISNGWNANELAAEIAKACINHDIRYSMDDARYLASKIVKTILADPRQFNGGFELGWD